MRYSAAIEFRLVAAARKKLGKTVEIPQDALIGRWGSGYRVVRASEGNKGRDSGEATSFDAVKQKRNALSFSLLSENRTLCSVDKDGQKARLAP